MLNIRRCVRVRVRILGVSCVPEVSSSQRMMLGVKALTVIQRMRKEEKDEEEETRRD